jgi:hypothetical protein
MGRTARRSHDRGGSNPSPARLSLLISAKKKGSGVQRRTL